MFAYTLPQELRHPEVWITEQSRYAYYRRQYLRIERSATIADQDVRLFAFNQVANELERGLRMHWQIGRQHIGYPCECFA